MSRHITARLALALAIFGSAEFEPHRLRALEPTAKTDSLADRQPVSPGELHVYGNAAGELSYALAMRATDLPQATSTQVVVLVDTSASQTGTYWEDTLAAVKSLGDRLRPSDRVALIAIDVQAVAMSEGFVAPQSDAWKQAFQRLQGRSPLGSTDLLSGLRTVLAQPWKNEASESRSVIYVGDGTSRADIISEQDLRAVTADFVKARITMHSFALGRQTDVALLAVLANHTGGNVFLDGPNVTAAQAGQELARVSQSAVLWPVAAEFPKGLDTRFPSDLPPLRSDRETILVGKLTAATGELLSIQITGECLGEAMPWKWETKVGASEGGYAYLPRLVEMTSRSQGFQFPVLGLRGLQIVQESLLTEASNFGDLAKQAAATGDLEGAERLAVAALKRDPSNRRAQSVAKSVREATAVSNSTPQATTEIAPLPTKTAPAATTKSKQPTQGKKKGQANKPGQLKESRSGEASFASPVRWKTVQFTGKQDSNFGGDVIGEQLISPSGDPISGDNFSDDNRVQSTDPDAGRLVDDSVARTRLQTEILTAEVKNAVKNAREQMRSNPEGVLQELKFELDAVRQAIDVNEGVRTRLADDLRRSIQETEHRKVEKDEQDQRLNQAQAVGVERLNLLEAAQQQEERIANLIAKYNRFTDEEDYPRASEVAESAHKLDTDNLTTIAANEVSQFKMNIEHALDVRERRHRAFHLIMDDIEATAIPFVGDPPIVYPDAEKWLQLTKRRKKWKDSVNLAQLGPAEQRIFDRFDDPTEMNYTDTPFSEVVADLENQHEIEIEIDTRALEDLGLSSENMQINRQLSGVSLRSALRLLLNDLDLTYLVRDEVLFITTPEEAQSKLVTKVYPVADIVIPIQSGGMGGGMMGGGMMGGMGGGMMGGGMGGMGGGMMGGGMGGMGGGMMGGGMGGMGGGMGGMGGFFAVPDAISLRDQLPADAASPAEPVTKSKPSVLQAPRSNGESLSEAWDRVFAQEVTPGNVRVTVQSLLKEKNYEDAVAVIYAALRHRQPQPWMYKALEIALRAQNASPAELERALLSGIDLAENLDEILEIAVYMSQLGLEKRALVIFRDLAEINPTRPEPYVYALAAAKRIDDVESLKWACLHIAEQSWSESERSFAEKAGRTARAIVDRLEKSGDTAAAAAFTQELHRALTRDIVAVVKWTGDADVDILVKEPSGTICSYQERRTTSGGCLLGDNYSAQKKKSVDGISEVYECGEGYSGQYQLCIRRIWGKVAAGKVTVDVYLHYGTPEQRRIRQVVPLGDKDTMVTFELADGRREQPLEEHQVAEAAQRQSVRLNQSVLAQQISSLADNNTVRDFVAARAGLIDPRLLAGRLRGAVGYRPEITQLPEGLSLTASAVVSADRRYVRITPSPFSSDIREVVRFNFVTGGQQTDGGGAGGGGAGGGAGGFGGGGFGGGGFGGGGGF